MRYERKYKIENLALPLVVQSIRLHPASFRKIFPDRQVNNIYFDTNEFSAFKENVMGVADRKKYRIRWYGDNFGKIENSNFEIKIKTNQLGDKITQVFPSFDLNEINFSKKEIHSFSKETQPLQPTLLNSYQRSYFGTPDGKFRITIDWEMQFESLLNKKKFNSYQTESQGVVLELKYDEALDGMTDSITQHLPYRLTKSSKYVTGMELTHP